MQNHYQRKYGILSEFHMEQKIHVVIVAVVDVWYIFLCKEKEIIDKYIQQENLFTKFTFT